MKLIKWKMLIITCVVCLLPILLGLSLWRDLPETIAIHFDICNNPDNFASKPFVVFMMPVFMAVLQGVCCIINDINEHKHGKRVKFSAVSKWIIPCMSIVVMIVTLAYSLGRNVDMRRFACLVVGTIFLVTGNYLPKLDYVKNIKVSTDKARKINRFVGYETVVMGVAMIVSIFFPPIVSVVCLVMLIPYVIIALAYGIVVGRK